MSVRDTWVTGGVPGRGWVPSACREDGRYQPVLLAALGLLRVRVQAARSRGPRRCPPARGGGLTASFPPSPRLGKPRIFPLLSSSHFGGPGAAPPTRSQFSGRGGRASPARASPQGRSHRRVLERQRQIQAGRLGLLGTRARRGLLSRPGQDADTCLGARAPAPSRARARSLSSSLPLSLSCSVLLPSKNVIVTSPHQGAQTPKTDEIQGGPMAGLGVGERERGDVRPPPAEPGVVIAPDRESWGLGGGGRV